jgi:hypothetical protein
MEENVDGIGIIIGFVGHQVLDSTDILVDVIPSGNVTFLGQDSISRFFVDRENGIVGIGFFSSVRRSFRNALMGNDELSVVGQLTSTCRGVLKTVVVSLPEVRRLAEETNKEFCCTGGVLLPPLGPP